MVANADNIAMSFDSAKWTFICRNSCSILSKVRSDKSFSEYVSGRDCRRLNYLIQRHNHHINVLPTIHSDGHSNSGSVHSQTNPRELFIKS